MRLHNSSLPTKLGLSTLAGLSLLTALAGCSGTTTAAVSNSEAPAASTAPTTSAVPSASATPDASTGASAGAKAGSTFKDGSYTEDGSYQSPAGTASITVKLTLASDVVTAVTVTGHSTDPTGKEYQQEFIGGISGQVVGKKITDLAVTKVAGSSLTSTGFRSAVTKIANEARA